MSVSLSRQVWRWGLGLTLCLLPCLLLYNCAGSSEKTGEAARMVFRNRTNHVLPSSTIETKVKIIWIGDTYGEYYQFGCSAPEFSQLASVMKLRQGEMDANVQYSTHWGKAVGEETPNDPAWWKLAPRDQKVPLFYLEDFVSGGASVMSLWREEATGAAFFKVEIWQ